MGFFVGNDFIPNLLHFHINKGALPLLHSAYMEVLPTLDGYIKENGQLNLLRFEKLMERLASIDYEQLLGVLPAASKALLPVAHHSLMSSIDSPIIDYYPSNFNVNISA